MATTHAPASHRHLRSPSPSVVPSPSPALTSFFNFRWVADGCMLQCTLGKEPTPAVIRGIRRREQQAGCNFFEERHPSTLAIKFLDLEESGVCPSLPLPPHPLPPLARTTGGSHVPHTHAVVHGARFVVEERFVISFFVVPPRRRLQAPRKTTPCAGRCC